MHAGKWLFVAVAFAMISGSPSAATISGTVFEWHSLEPLPNAILEINTTPKQVQVAESGSYSFQAPPGDYNIIAEYFEDSKLAYIAREEITIAQDGNFNLDIIMFPALGDEDFFFGDFNTITFPAENTDAKKPRAPDLMQVFLGIAIIAFLLYAAAKIAPAILKKATGLETERLGAHEKLVAEAEFLEANSGKGGAEQRRETSPNTLPQKLDKDLGEALEIIEKSGGRITQKELRGKMPQHGEAKVSLIVAELEELGLVKKFRKGRGNIIVLKEKQ